MLFGIAGDPDPDGASADAKSLEESGSMQSIMNKSLD